MANQILPNQGAPFTATSRTLDDSSQLQQVQLDIGTGGNASPVTALNPLPVTSSETQYALKLDEVGSLTYIGEAATGSLGADAVWRIKRIDESSGLVITWADGSAAFDQVWDDRASLIYS